MELANPLIVDQLGALAQAHRLAVFRLLVVAGPAGRLPGEIAGDLGIPPSSLSFHLAQLRRAGLVTVAAAGRERRYLARFDAMRDLVDYLTDNCCGGASCAAPGATESHAA
jgi:DNA-binding transcriptional ArsR family regulator